MNITYVAQIDQGSNVSTSYLWPPDNSLWTETLADRPLTPGPPYLVEDMEDSALYLTWNAREEDDTVEAYELQALVRIKRKDTVPGMIFAGIDKGRQRFPE